MELFFFFFFFSSQIYIHSLFTIVCLVPSLLLWRVSSECAYHDVILCYCYCSDNKEAVSQEEIKKYQMITDDADLELILSVAESLHAGERNVSPVG